MLLPTLGEQQMAPKNLNSYQQFAAISVILFPTAVTQGCPGVVMKRTDSAARLGGLTAPHLLAEWPGMLFNLVFLFVEVNKRLQWHNKDETSQDSKVWISLPNTESQLRCWVRRKEPWLWGVIAPSWWNEFFTVFHPQSTGLENHPQERRPLWKFRSPVEKFQHAPGAKNLKSDALKRITGTVSLYPSHHSSKTTQFSVKKDLGLWFILWGKVRAWGWVPNFPRCAGHTQSRRPTSFSCHPEYWVTNYPTGGCGAPGGEQQVVL